MVNRGCQGLVCGEQFGKLSTRKVSFAGPHHIFPNDRYPRVLHFRWA